MVPPHPAQVAAVLDGARRAGRTLDASAVDVGDLACAYAVQLELTALRLGRGDSVVGWKLGYTTQAMRDQMGIDAPNHGPLLASMRMAAAPLPGTLLQPKAEPEIALVLARDVRAGAGPADVLAACARAALALEVVDSVWTGYRFDLEHNTADGSSAAGFVLGEDLPLDRVTVDVALVVEAPPGAGAVGAPETGRGSLAAAAEAVAWLAGSLEDDPRGLRPGDVVLTGGLTRAVDVVAGSLVRATAYAGGVVAEVRVSGRRA